MASAAGGMAQSMSVSDRRKMFEVNSGLTGSSNVIHDSLRKTKPTLSKRVTSPNISSSLRATSNNSESATDTSPPSKKSVFSRKNSSSKDSKKLTRASSDADIVESKSDKYRNSTMEDSPKHSKSSNSSPSQTGGKRLSTSKRRDAPKPPTQSGGQQSPKHQGKESPNGLKSLKQGSGSLRGQSRASGEKPARPPSPKKVVRDKDLEITLSDGGCGMQPHKFVPHRLAVVP